MLRDSLMWNPTIKGSRRTAVLFAEGLCGCPFCLGRLTGRLEYVETYGALLVSVRGMFFECELGFGFRV